MIGKLTFPEEVEEEEVYTQQQIDYMNDYIEKRKSINKNC